MADIRAFRAFRYDLGRVGALSDVVAPPYDVINEEQQQELYDQSDYNSIRLILSKELPDDTESENRYTRTARLLKEWIAEDILIQDTSAGLYVYHQEFEWEGQTHIRRGYLARVRLEPFGEGKIYPHEETMPGPKADRLKLITATQMNLSPIFGMYPDHDNEIQLALDDAVGQALPLEAKDHLGVINRLWAVTDEEVISHVKGLMGNKPIFIADGHHRYETGLRYLEERRKQGDVAHEEAAPCFIMMMLVSMSDPGLIIQPTHRLLSGIPSMKSSDLSNLLSAQFDLETIGQGEEAAQSLWEMIEIDGSQDVLGFGTVADKSWHLARLRDRSRLEELEAKHSDDWRGLAVSVLHSLVINDMLGSRVESKPACRYVHQLSEVLESCSSGETRLAALVQPAQLETVRQI